MSNILLVYSTLTPSVKLCALEPLLYLDKNIKICVKPTNFSSVKENSINWADIIVIVRACEKNELDIIKACKGAGKYIIYVLDDDLLNVPQKNIDSAVYYNLPDIKNNIINIFKMSNMLWTPNINLLNKYGSLFDKSILIDEPVLEQSSYPLSEDIIRIGFAGSIDHSGYIDTILENTVKEIIRRYGNRVCFEFFGAKPRIVSDLALKHIPYCTEYEQYKSIMKELNWEIGLAPLIDSEFHKCKYFNKYVEYGALGIVGVYSRVEPFTFIIEDKVNGLIVDNTSEAWTTALCELIENKELRKEIKSNVELQIKNRFTVEKVADDILNKVPELLTYRADKSKKIKLKFLKLRYYFNKIYYIIRKYKFGIFVKIITKLLNK